MNIYIGVGVQEHKPVMLAEALDSLALQADGVYVDATFGRGGHTQAILAKLGPKAVLIVIDKDRDALAVARELAAKDSRVKVLAGSYVGLPDFCEQHALVGRINGILFDLGVSSPQLDSPSRGFSFRFDSELDMRMDQSSGQTVAKWLAEAEETEISRVLREYGEERFARRIARSIVEYRDSNLLTNTSQLVEIIDSALPYKEKHKHPATRSFQALRIFINDELTELSQVLPATVKLLAPKGRLVVISFHSLEDRIVKNFIQAEAVGQQLPRFVPVKSGNVGVTLKKLKKIKAGDSEVSVNPRARSAIMRVAEKLSVSGGVGG